MRMPQQTGWIRGLMVTTCVLLFGSALAAGGTAYAATGAAARSAVAASDNRPAAYTLRVNNPGNQVSNPLPATPDLTITATTTDPDPALTYSAVGLPPGLGIGLDTGTIYGTITAPYTGEVTVTVEDWTTLQTANATFTWSAGVRDHVTVTAPAKEQTWVGFPLSVQVKAKDSDTAEKLTYSATGLPAGLSINPATGAISGAPQKVTTAKVKVTAVDAAGFAGSAVIKWLVGWAVTMPDPGTVTTVVGQGLTVRLTYSDILGGDRVTLWATGLPPGVTFEQKPPTVYGWAVTAGTYHVEIHAHGSRGDLSLMTFPLIVHPASGGPSGQIHLTLGKCLTDPGNRTANGTRVVLANCQQGAAERWTIWSDGTVRVRNRCLDIAGTGSSAGQQVQLWQCTGSPRETWMPGTAGELVNPASGLCLTDPGSSRRNGTIATIGTCRFTPSATWTLPALPILAAVPGKCVDDLHSVGTNGNVIDMYTCNGTPVQSWTFEPDGTLRIFGDKCITVRGTKIQLWTCTAGNKAQRWTVVRTGGLSAELTLGGACLAVPSMNAADGSQLVTARCTATDPRVHWHIW